MERVNIILANLVVLFVTTTMSAQCFGKKQSSNQIPNKKISFLSTEEKKDLLTLREEEKLARDVYLYAFDKYRLKIFKNISNSEQTHMDRVLQILTLHNIADPSSRNIGVFNNEELQKLYNSLIKKVDISIEEALSVGATIEDLDIKDILEFKERTSNTEILNMYNHLECGSRNHLRAYYSNLKNHGINYTPQYISQLYFDEIVNSEKERCGNKKTSNLATFLQLTYSCKKVFMLIEIPYG